MKAPSIPSAKALVQQNEGRRSEYIALVTASLINYFQRPSLDASEGSIHRVYAPELAVIPRSELNNAATLILREKGYINVSVSYHNDGRNGTDLYINFEIPVFRYE